MQEMLTGRSISYCDAVENKQYAMSLLLNQLTGASPYKEI